MSHDVPVTLQPGEVLAPIGGKTLQVVAVPHAPDGSGYYRLYLPFKGLTDNSRHLILIAKPGAAPPIPTPADVADIDVFIAQRPCGPVGMREWEALKGHTALVYETDDDLINVAASGLPHLMNRRMRESIIHNIQRSDLVTVSTPYLAEEMRQYNDNVAVLPNYIHEDMLAMQRKHRPQVTVGWGGGTSHLMDIAVVQDPLTEVLGLHPEVDMHWLGMDYTPLVKRPCRWSPWSNDVWEYYRNIDFDIALAPLADHKFNYSKSNLKALETAALGVPIIATDLPPYHDFVIDGVTGFLVTTPEEWVDRLELLIADDDLRTKMGESAREHAAGFTMQEHWVEWERVYEEVGYGVGGQG